MRKSFIVIILSCLLPVLFTAGCAGEKVPDIRFDGQSYKFGEVNAGEDIVFTFFFTNPGKKDLVIKELFVSCFCVNIRQYDKVVPPGGKGKIYGVIKTTGFLGDITKAIRVDTNIPGIESPVLTLEGKILPPKAEK